MATFKSVLGEEWTCRYLGSERLLSNLDWLLSKYFSSQNVGNLVPIFSSTNCHQISMKKLPHLFLQPHIILAKDTHWICSDSSIFRHACPIRPLKFEFRKISLTLYLCLFGYRFLDTIRIFYLTKCVSLFFDCDDNIELYTALMALYGQEETISGEVNNNQHHCQIVLLVKTIKVVNTEKMWKPFFKHDWAVPGGCKGGCW